MPLLEQLKKAAEKVTGLGRPAADELQRLINRRRPLRYRFEDDGETPNNARLPLLHYRGVFRAARRLDPAAVCEEVFAANGWGDSWRDGIYDFLHFHTQTHEVLGIARGWARVQFGGGAGRTLTLRAGDVVVLPAGTGHRRIRAGKDLLVVGAYPPTGRYDEPRPGDVPHRGALARIARVAVPRSDPLYGKAGPLREFWKR